MHQHNDTPPINTFRDTHNLLFATIEEPDNINRRLDLISKPTDTAQRKESTASKNAEAAGTASTFECVIQDASSSFQFGYGQTTSIGLAQSTFCAPAYSVFRLLSWMAWPVVPLAERHDRCQKTLHDPHHQVEDEQSATTNRADQRTPTTAAQKGVVA